MSIPVVDLHADLPWRIAMTGCDPLVPSPGEHLDLPRLRAGGVAVLGTVIYTPADEAAPGRAAAWGERLWGIVEDLLRRSDGAFEAVRDAEGVDARCGMPDRPGPGLLLTMEGVAPLEGEAGRLDAWADRGLRFCGLTHNPRNQAGDGTGVPAAERQSGLTAHGRDVVARAGRLGVVPDIAHLAEEACGDLFAAARGPVVCTHAGVRGVTDHWRNLSDDQVRAVAATGGVVGIDFYGPHVGRSGTAVLEDVVAHLEHVAALVGVEHVALGADFAGFDDDGVTGLEDAACYPALLDRLAARGWSGADRAALGHRNVVRVLAEAERAAGA